MSVSGDLAREEATASPTFVIDGDEQTLAIDHVRFVEAQPTGYREYTKVEEPVYGVGETIRLYCEPKGLTVETRDGKQWIEFYASMTATGPDGGGSGRESNEFEMQIPAEEEIEELFLFFEMDLRQPALGDHTVEVTIQDRVQRGEATETTSFAVEDEDLSLVAVFEEVITDELDIEIERLTFRHDTLTLDYRSGHSYEDDKEEFNGEIGSIAGVYAGIIDSAELFRGLVEDDISEREYLEELFRTLRTQD